MNGQSSSHYGLSRILRETFQELDLNQSACLVGILYECQIKVVDGNWVLPALEPEEATRVIAELFNHNEQRLLQRFRNHWRVLRHSMQMSNLIDQLQAHEWVDEIIAIQCP
ncbi:MAG: hypothetical protein AAFU85_11835 [Planctomycetota bacterium]